MRSKRAQAIYALHAMRPTSPGMNRPYLIPPTGNLSFPRLVGRYQLNEMGKCSLVHLKTDGFKLLVLLVIARIIGQPLKVEASRRLAELFWH